MFYRAYVNDPLDIARDFLVRCLAGLQARGDAMGDTCHSRVVLVTRAKEFQGKNKTVKGKGSSSPEQRGKTVNKDRNPSLGAKNSPSVADRKLSARSERVHTEIV